MPINNLSTPPQRSWTQKFFARFIAAHPKIEAPDERRKAELTAALSLSFALIIFIGILFTLALTGWNLLVTAGFLFIGAASTTYWLSRGKRYTLAARVFIGGFALLAYTASFSREYVSLFIILTFSILFLLANLLELKWMIWVIIANAIAVILASALFFPQLEGIEALNTYAGVITLGLFVLLFAWHRKSLERLRLDKILIAQSELEKSNLELEKAQNQVRKRFAELQLAAQVGRTVSQVNDPDRMLQQATALIQEEFDLYYVQIYLTDKNNTRLTLKAGTGEIGQQLLARSHSLLISAASINGLAALKKQAVVIPDTGKSATFLKNPLLPNTRGEMALPLIVRNRTIGVLDIQSREANVLTEETLPAFEALAGQLAIAIRNAELLEEAEENRLEIEAQARRQTRTAWNQYMDGIYKAEKFGYRFDREKITSIDEQEEIKEDDSPLLEAPIAWLGEELGSLVVKLAPENQTDQNKELVNTVARQIAQQIENLRLLEEAERYLHIAEETSRRHTRAGWKAYMQAREGKSMSYLYDSVKVIPLEKEQEDDYELSLPLKARNEEVGKLAVKGVSADDEEMLELSKAVAERLGAQIENLRLFEKTQTSLSETAKALREVKKLGSAIQQSIDGIALASMDGNLEFMNEAWATMHGYEVSEINSLLGQSLALFHTEKQLQEEVFPFNQIVEKNGLNQGEVGHKRKDGSTFPTWMSVSVLLDEEKKPLALVASAQDITERKRIEAAVQKRAAELATVAKISTQITTLHETEEISQSVVDLSKENFGLYHAHIYMLDEAKENLVLAAGAGETGAKMVAEGWKIPLTWEDSLVARTAREKQGFIINNVREEEGFLANPLLPDTAAELAVPLIIENTVLGVLDVQSNEVDYFTEEDLNIQTTLAAQIAVAIQNARSFKATQEQAEYEAKINLISQRIQGTTNVEEALQVAVRELGRALGARQASIQLDATTKQRS